MIIGQRLRERIEAVGSSQAGLARAVGLHQTTINQLINNGGNSRYLHKIARELRTTPAYLTGETDDPQADAPDDIFSAEERGWVELLREASPKDRKLVLELARRLAGSLANEVHGKRHTSTGEG